MNFKKTKIDFAVGGQAVIEGVMMRSPEMVTIAVRKADNSIKVKKDKYEAVAKRYKILNLPIIRGVVNLFEMMIIGTKAINYSADEMIQDDMTQDEKDKLHKKRQKPHYRVIEAVLFIISMIVALAISLSLFKALPLAITTFFESRVDALADSWIFFNLVDGILKVLIFLAYIYILSLFPSFKRIFEYHGAEHKAIFNYESGLPLTVENAAKQSRFHPRCGTSFILIVFIFSIIVYTFVPRHDTFLENLLFRLLFLPLIAGISYEYLKLSAKYVNNIIVKALVQPGLWLQRLTTREPNPSQLEVSLASLKAALEMENR